MKIRRMNIVFYVLIMFVMVLIPFGVKADTPHNINLKMVKCDADNYNGLATYDDYESCQIDYLDGALDTYTVNPGDEIDPGTTLMFILNYEPGSPEVITGLQTRLVIDTDVWMPAEDEDGLIYFESDQFPSKSNYVTDWNYNSNLGVMGGSFMDYKSTPRPITKPTTEEKCITNA